jgi:hypothetical protein
LFSGDGPVPNHPETASKITDIAILVAGFGFCTETYVLKLLDATPAGFDLVEATFPLIH